MPHRVGPPGGEPTPTDPTTIVQTGSSGQTGACPTTASQCTNIAALGTLTVQITGRAGIPATGVSAVAINMISTNNTSNGALIAYPTGGTAPADPMVAHTGTQDGTGLEIVPVSSSGQITLLNYGGATTGVLASVEGWISTGTTTGDVFAPTDPVRVLNAATGTGTCTPSPCAAIPSGSSTTVAVAGQATIPASGVKAVMANITVISPTSIGLLDVTASTGTAPSGLNLIYNNGQTESIEAIVPLGTDGAIKLASLGPTTLTVSVDIQGWYTATNTTWTYTYNGDGTRTTKTGPAGTTTYTTDTADPLPETLQETTGGATTYYIWGADGLPIEQINPDSSTYYLHHDQLGSTRGLTNTTGTTIATYTYNPYGQTTNTTGSATTPYQYAGNYTDTETGYQYNHARFYDPTTGTFLSRDPLEQTTTARTGTSQRPS